MKDFNLVWKSFRFHTEQILELESEFLIKSNRVVEVSNPTTKKSQLIFQSFIEVVNKLINSYLKQSKTIDELIEFNRYYSLHGMPLPEGEKVSLQSLFNLKNATCTLVNSTKKRKDKVIEIFS
jgi:hypothetical protein